MRARRAGHSGVLVECADLDEVMALDRALRHTRPQGVVDLVPAAVTLLVTFDPALTSPERVEAAVYAADLLPAALADAAPAVVIPVRYDGEDLGEVARLTGRSPEEVIACHAGAAYTVAFVGFAPGFAYLVGGDPGLQVPRRATPRTRVPAGSVALAGRFSGIYPREGPGGWQLVGRTDAVLWDPDRDPPALLAPGTRVRFVDLARDQP